MPEIPSFISHEIKPQRRILLEKIIEKAVFLRERKRDKISEAITW
jgi:hypothetical protein